MVVFIIVLPRPVKEQLQYPCRWTGLEVVPYRLELEANLLPVLQAYRELL